MENYGTGGNTVTLNPATQNPDAAPRESLLLDSGLLNRLGEISEQHPALTMTLADRETQREFRYALTSLVCGTVVTLGVIGSFVYLVVIDHPKSAAALLSVGVLNVIQGFIRNRLRSTEDKKKSAKAKAQGSLPGR